MARTDVAATIDRIRRQLSSNYRHEVNRLSGNINSTATSLVLAEGITPNIRPGAMLNIGTELMRVTAVNDSTDTVDVIREFFDSTAASHSAGDIVWVNSRFTGLDIFDALYDEISSYGPQLYRVVTAELDLSFTQDVVELPVSFIGCYGLVDVNRKWADPSPHSFSYAWPRADVRLIRYDPTVWSEYPTSGIAIRLIDNSLPSKLIVRGALPFNSAFGYNDDLVTDVGLPESMLDVVSMGVRLRLLTDNEAGVYGRTVQDEPRRTQETPPGAQVTTAQLNNALYRNRKQEEINKLRALYPIRIS